jgi:hypothetical protein
MLVMSKPKRKPPKRKGKPLYLYIDSSIRDALDAAVEEIEPRSSLTAIVEIAIKEWLRGKGRWPVPSQP